MFGLFEKDFSGGDVVRQVRNRLVKRLDGEAHALPRELYLVIADDSDHHRSRTGYMKYDAGHVVAAGENRLFLALGEAHGDYPPRPFDCDLMALKLTWDWKGPSDVIDYFDRAPGMYIAAGQMPFNATLLLAMASGELCDGGDWTRFQTPIKAALADPDVRKHMVQPVERDPRYIAASTLQQVVSRPARFSSAIVNPLTEKLIEILSA